MSKRGPGKFFIPISSKLSAMTLTLMLAAAIPIAVRTSALVKDTSGKREEESNRSQANSRAAEINGLLESYVDKLAVIGTLQIQEAASKKPQTDDTPSNVILRRDKDLVGFELYRRDDQGKLVSMFRYTDDRYLKGYNLAKSYLDDLAKSKPFPVEALFSGQPVLRNRSIAKSAPLVSLGVPVAKDALGRVTHVAVGDLPLSLLQRGFAKATERVVFLVDKDGNLLAHPDDKLVMNGTNFATSPIVKAASTSKVAQGQLKYQDPKRKNERFISAYAKCLFDLAVISEAPESVVLEPARLVQMQVYYIAGIVVSIGFLIVYIFSLTFTRPIKTLVGFAGEVAKGNFNILATKFVRSRDEVGTLAFAFDGMTSGLRERDKVRNLMNKFHGAAVTDNLMESDHLELGGVKKNVAVFFSDIRGFTAFSENKTPEEVIGMLNEYFQEMVTVITNRQGVVDKFIGDAIMAVWGAPKSTGDDPYHAVMACLEMRIALEALNKRRMARGDVPIKIGMGLHYGEAISGNIGSQDRMERTVIGDTVNMSSRIESSTKAFGTDLLLSEDIAHYVRDRFILEDAGSAEVKGKTEPLKFYKVRGYIDQAGQQVVVTTEWSDYEAEKADKVKVVP